MKCFFVLVFSLIQIPLPVICQENSRDYWIDRYLSVSYPLDHIKINSSFGMRKDPFTGKSARHNGLDLQARNENVMAMFDGTVEKIGSDSRSGNYVVLRHGSYLVSYCHLSRVIAVENESLLAGDVVGITGSTGRSTGEHLHITCRYNGELMDPYLLLKAIRNIRKECADALKKDGLTDSARHVFIEKYAAAAIEEQKRFGIPASVTLAQMALESNWGQSRLAVHDNNYFGIKASARWLAEGRPYSVYDDDKKNEKFCVFEDVFESIEYHSEILMGNRYRRCRQYGEDDWYNWLLAIKECGYATSDTYVRECSKIIRQYDLPRYDRMGL